METLLLGGGSGSLGIVVYFLWKKAKSNGTRIAHLEDKLDRIAEDTAFIRGRLEGWKPRR